MKNKYFYYIILACSLSSCAYIFNEIFLPNRCRVCELKDHDGNVLWKEDECGGGVAKMEERCKLEAYDYFIDGKQVECFCKRYKKKGD